MEKHAKTFVITRGCWRYVVGAFLYAINAGHGYTWPEKSSNEASVRMVS